MSHSNLDTLLSDLRELSLVPPRVSITSKVKYATGPNPYEATLLISTLDSHEGLITPYDLLLGIEEEYHQRKVSSSPLIFQDSEGSELTVLGKNFLDSTKIYIGFDILKGIITKRAFCNFAKGSKDIKTYMHDLLLDTLWDNGGFSQTRSIWITVDGQIHYKLQMSTDQKEFPRSKLESHYSKEFYYHPPFLPVDSYMRPPYNKSDF